MSLADLKKHNQVVGSKTFFAQIGVVDVDVDPREHFPKKKDASGKTVKDENGKDVRLEQSDGWTYLFVEYGTARKVMVILPKKYQVEPLQTYYVSGFGYNLSKAGMLYLDQAVKVEKIA